MVRATSKAALLKLNEIGALGFTKQRVMHYVLENPGCSRGEISRNSDNFPVNAVCGRVKELLKTGHLYEGGCKKDTVTGMVVQKLFANDDLYKVTV